MAIGQEQVVLIAVPINVFVLFICEMFSEGGILFIVCLKFQYK